MKRTVQYILAALAVLLLWEGASLILLATRGRMILPTPVATLGEARQYFGELASAFGASALRFLLSLLISFAIGLPLGLLIGFERNLYQALSPLIYLTYPIPPVALLVFLYLAFGVGEAVKVVVITAALFFQVLVAAQGAARGIPRTYVTAVRSAGASRWQLYRHVVVPATLPEVLTSARVSVGLGITMLYIVETKLGLVGGPRTGLGRFIEYYTFRAELSLAGVVGLSLLGLMFYALLELLERWLCRWKHVGGPGGA
ncbi:TPA: ABC transporter permease subunit [Candidatus Bipolaricaulota bacterium]|nr:ABC transporter permease subunit [Candidatus Bipolaricaulota bacterium]HIP99583.1 ABC transporter permease subunit [Candidatus Bipolaricaulota bacterium]